MTAGRTVVAGEALIDVIHDGDAVTKRPGGGPFNAARTIARLGPPVSFLGCLSSDADGRRLRELLAADGVALDLALQRDLPTTRAHARLRDGVATYAFEADGTAAVGLMLADVPRMPQDVAALLVGTLGLVFEPIASTLEALTTRADPSTMVVVDPNCRPSAIADARAYRDRLDRVLARSDVVKVSTEDLGWLLPGVSIVEGARALLSHGARVALVTLGAEGALVVTAPHAVQVPAPPAVVIDTIGAGDAFAGGFIAAWLDAGHAPADLDAVEPVVAAARFACTVAARTCERAGADPPTLVELNPPRVAERASR
jgi:fructokinase